MGFFLAIPSRGKPYGVVGQSSEPIGLVAEARVPVDADFLEEVFELGGDEGETGADDGGTFAGAGEDEEGHRVVCDEIQKMSGDKREGKRWGREFTRGIVLDICAHEDYDDARDF